MSLFSRTKLSDRSEQAAQKTLTNIRARRRSRFRVLACIDGSEASYDTVRFAARLTPQDNSAIVILYVRPIDKGAASGGLNVRVARQNLLEAGGELPGLMALKHSLKILKEEGLDVESWERENDHREAWGDPVGDNKVFFKSKEGRTVVLKLKTAPDVASGILDQYHYGPYNLIIMNEPSRWRGEFKSIFDSGVVQRVTALAPCSVLIAREESLENKGFLIYNDGTARGMQAIRRSAVLAHTIGEPITLLSVAEAHEDREAAQEANKTAQEMLTSLGIKIDTLKTLVGEPAIQIIKAGANKELIVVPDEGHSRLKRAITGSTAYSVIKGAVTSVMDVR